VFLLEERRELATIAEEHGKNLDAELLLMEDWAKSKGEKRKDWVAFARGWLRRNSTPGPITQPKESLFARADRLRREEEVER